jgi:hypothetical protein
MAKHIKTNHCKTFKDIYLEGMDYFFTYDLNYLLHIVFSVDKDGLLVKIGRGEGIYLGKLSSFSYQEFENYYRAITLFSLSFSLERIAHNSDGFYFSYVCYFSKNAFLSCYDKNCNSVILKSINNILSEYV